MRRVLLSAVMGMTALDAQASVVRTDEGMQITIDAVDFTASRYQGFQQARFRGVDSLQATTIEVGAPELPVLRFYVDGDVRIRLGDDLVEAKIQGDEPLVPVQPSRLKVPGPEPMLVMKQEAYASRILEDSTPYSIEEAGSVRGVRRRLVTLRPLAYAAATGEYRLHRHFKIEFLNHDAPDVTTQEIFAFVVGEKFARSSALARYAALKESLGYHVEYVEVGPRDTPETIRARLQTLYAGHHGARLTQVLLVGDASDVPGKIADHISGVTDHYYRAIDTNDYDSDINGPDVGVGRWSVSSEEQLVTVIDKLTRYHTGAFLQQDWLNDIAWIATDDRYEVAEGTHNYVINTYTQPRGYQGVYPSSPQHGGDQLYAITHRVSDHKVHEVLGLGRTIVNYSGHGSTTSWAGPNVSRADVRRLADPNALPFVISNACITGDYRVSEAFAETWLRHRAGAIAFWGSMDSSYWDEDDILERRLFDGVFRDGRSQFGEITSFALSEHWRHYQGGGRAKYYWETYVLFGDPSLNLRTTRARAIRLEGPESLPVGSSEVSYHVVDASNAQPVAGTRVALSIPGQSFKVTGISDAEGMVVLSLGNASRNVVNFIATASGANIQSVTSDLAIIPTDDAYLSFSGLHVNDRQSDIAYPGESIALGLAISNLGQSATRGGQVRIRKIGGPATISSSVARVPAMAARAVARLGNGLQLTLNTDANDGDRIRIELAWETQEGQSGTTTLNLRVARAVINVTHVDFGVANTEGGIRPGESGEVFLTVKNVGSEILRQGELRAEIGHCIAAVEGDVAMSELAPGASLRLAPLTVSLDEQCSSGKPATMTLVGQYQSQAQDLALNAQANFTTGVLTTATLEHTNINRPIRDNAVIQNRFQVEREGLVDVIGIHVRLRHTYIGDLRISLVHPDGTEVVLHNREGGGRDQLEFHFGLGGTALPALATLRGKAAAGAWRLVIQDLATSDSGTLDYVKLSIQGYLN